MHTFALCHYLSPHLTLAHTQGTLKVKYSHTLLRGMLLHCLGEKCNTVTVCILRFCSTPGDSRGKPFGSPLAHQGFPGGSAGKEFTCNAADLDPIRVLGRSPGEGKGYPFQHSGLENSMDCIVHRVARAGHDWATFTLAYQLAGVNEG